MPILLLVLFFCSIVNFVKLLKQKVNNKPMAGGPSLSVALLLAANRLIQLCPGLLASDGIYMGTYLCGLAVQGAQEGREALEFHLFHWVLVKTRLEIPGRLFLLFRLGCQEHQSGQE